MKAKKSLNKLEKIFRLYNRRYFSGRLPQIPVDLAYGLPRGTYGHLHFHIDEMDGHTCKPGSRLQICVNVGLRRWGEVICQTILHEMIHLDKLLQGVRAGGDHGEIFKKEKRRLEKAGALHDLW